jgi:rSAM/selenodomain-associated transferase 1
MLAVFAKWPEPGRVKTRLAAETSVELAAELAEAMLRDIVRRASAIAAERWLVHAPNSVDGSWASLGLADWQLTPQGDGDLGCRLRRFAQRRLARGDCRIVIIGSDSPTLPVSYLREAFAALEHADIVLGPAADGGYYLLGLTSRLPPIFEGIDWGTSEVLRQTVARLDGFKLALLPPWYDVDTLDDVRLLAGHLEAMRRAGVDPEAPCCEAVLKRRVV